MAVILKPENTYYVSLFQAIIYTRPVAVLVPNEGDPTLIVPYLDLEHAKERSPVPDIKSYQKEVEFYKILKESLIKRKNIGIDIDSLTILNKIKRSLNILYVKNISKELIELRMIKDDAEIERIKLAAQITDLGMKTVMKKLQERKSEIRIATEAEYAMKLKLSEILGNDGYYPWMNWTVSAVLSGTRSYYPHGMISGKTINEGDVVIVTLDIAVEGYRAENERTFIIGKLNANIEEAFNIMEEAQSSAIKSLSPGIKSKEVDMISKKVFKRHNVIKYIKHSTGHGIGLEIHEPPFFTEKTTTVLKENMVVCIEPGIYIPNLGGFRHSDTVLITKNNPEILTKTPKDLNSLII